MKTGIEKFKNIVNKKTCDLLIKHFENNINQSADLDYEDNLNNVICKQLYLPHRSELDNCVYKSITNVLEKYQKKYPRFKGTGDTGYQLRRISGTTRQHIDDVFVENTIRTVSIILGLNSDYEKGEFHFPEQKFTTTVKQGEAIIFPVYFLYPHSVDSPIGYRYTINTWITTATSVHPLRDA